MVQCSYPSYKCSDGEGVKMNVGQMAGELTQLTPNTIGVSLGMIEGFGGKVGWVNNGYFRGGEFNSAEWVKVR